MKKKTCPKCNKTKSLNRFSKNKSRSGGYNSWCKNCIKQWQQYNKEHISEYRKSHYENNKEYYKKYNEDNKKNNIIKIIKKE